MMIMVINDESLGHPNVGKSTVINTIFGRTVVSTSKTPGKS
jgi:ribosome biogenesis GTPase A